MPHSLDEQIRCLCRVLDLRARYEARLEQWAIRKGWAPLAVRLLVEEYRRRLFERSERLRHGKADHA